MPQDGQKSDPSFSGRTGGAAVASGGTDPPGRELRCPLPLSTDAVRNRRFVPIEAGESAWCRCSAGAGSFRWAYAVLTEQRFHGAGRDAGPRQDG
jgi:hypothetical protein